MTCEHLHGGSDVHLQHFLVPASIELPWYKGIIQGVKEMINPPKLPPLEITSKPVEMASLKGLYGGHETTAGVGSVVIHVAVVALLLFVGSLKPVQKAMKEFVPIFAPDLKPLQPKPKPEQSKGGGGSPQKTEVTKGQLPKVAPKSFVPPIRTVRRSQAGDDSDHRGSRPAQHHSQQLRQPSGQAGHSLGR